jgi:hypothetical protein
MNNKRKKKEKKKKIPKHTTNRSAYWIAISL